MIPALYFPTSIILLDDNIISLDTYNYLLSDKYSNIVYTNPDEVINFFNNYSSPLGQIQLFKKADKLDIDSSATKCFLELDIAKIYELANSTTKYSEVSLLITDYHMPPHIDGMKLCSQFKEKYFKKLLLTENNDYSMAVQALNDKTIDYFANKTDSSEIIIEAVNTLVYNYFCDYTNLLCQTLNVDKNSPLFDCAFEVNFKQIVKSYNIKEFYLIDVNGSFLLKSQTGKSYILVNHDDASLSQLIEHLNEYNLYDTHIENLRQRKTLPFFGINQQLSSKKLNSIDKYIYQSNLLAGNKHYYWQVIEHCE